MKRQTEWECRVDPQNSEILKPRASEIVNTATASESCPGYQNRWRKRGHCFVIWAEMCRQQTDCNVFDCAVVAAVDTTLTHWLFHQYCVRLLIILRRKLNKANIFLRSDKTRTFIQWMFIKIQLNTLIKLYIYFLRHCNPQWGRSFILSTLHDHIQTHHTR
jgi:hypothetical protein